MADLEGNFLKRLISTLLLCFVLISQSLAGSYYNKNDWRNLPFVEMMAAMIRAMNDIMGGGGNNYSPGLYGMPYSPAFMPGMGNNLYGMNNFPMASSFPANNFSNGLNDNFQTGQNTGNNNYSNSNSSSFWDLNNNNSSVNNKQTGVYNNIQNNNMNGIWQSQTGNVMAIYNNNRFIWSDGNKRNIAGRLLIKNNILYAYVPAKKTTLQFQFYREPNKFIVKDNNSRVYTFTKIY